MVVVVVVLPYSGCGQSGLPSAVLNCIIEVPDGAFDSVLLKMHFI